jgi:hypothetical protein
MLAKDIQETMAEVVLPPGLNIITAYIDHKDQWEFLIDHADFLRFFRVCEYEKNPFNDSVICSIEWQGCVFKSVKR